MEISADTVPIPEDPDVRQQLCIRRIQTFCAGFRKIAYRVGSRPGTALPAAAGNTRAEFEAGGTNGSQDTRITYIHTYTLTEIFC